VPPDGSTLYSVTTSSDSARICGGLVLLASKPIHILIADDHPVVREGLRRLLNRQEDFQIVGEAETGVEAVASAQALQPDIVILDIRIPRLSGIRACRRIVDTVEGTRVVMLTSFASDKLVFAAMRAGASGYVLKRMAHGELFDTIRRVHHGEDRLDPALAAELTDEVRTWRERQWRDAFADLTEREIDVLALVAEGLKNQEIAQALSLGRGTVRNYVSNVLSKLGVPNRTAAAAYATEHQIAEVIGRIPDDQA
jgi:two-component system response regulator DevR